MFANGFVAEAGGVSLPELNSLEVDFLTRLDYRVSVQLPELEEKLQEMASFRNELRTSA